MHNLHHLEIDVHILGRMLCTTFEPPPPPPRISYSGGEAHSQTCKKQNGESLGMRPLLSYSDSVLLCVPLM